MPPRIICVLGMHSSGTSVAAGVLNVLGASLGPEDQLVPAAPDNPRGFSEHSPIVVLNDDLLARLGGRAFAPPRLLPGWESLPELDDLRERGERIVRESFAGAAVTVWKDPRTCLTLPFWQRLMPPMRYVICVRHPADVAGSLHHRNRVWFERSCYLWLLYTRYAMSGTIGHPRCVVVYDRLIDNPTQEVRMLASFLGTPARTDQPGVKAALEILVDAGLRHHRRTLPEERLGDLPAGGSSPAFRLAELAYELLARAGPFDDANLDYVLASALKAVRRNAVPRPSLRHGEPLATRGGTDQTT